MLFNTVQFLIFFLVVFIPYLFLSHRWQNRLLLLASCIFYGAWEWRLLFLIFTSVTVDYFCSLGIYNSDNRRRRKLLLITSIIINLSILAFFKYFNFFNHNFVILCSHFGFKIDPFFLKIVLPVGISFYTFQSMSYTIDTYRREIRPTGNYLDYALFLTYFPHLLAGPIMRAKSLLTQIQLPRQLTLRDFYAGCYLILWGLFQKMVIADNLAKIVDPLFNSQPPYRGFDSLIAAYAFSLQIFCDFAGYSNIARGLGKCMGFNIIINFNAPYFSTNPVEFWRRWHISLSTWLRDYLYIPLGGNRLGTLFTYRNIAITMLLGGLWHGAAWTFIVWGAYQCILLIGYKLMIPYFKKSIFSMNAFVKKVIFVTKVIFFFNLVSLGFLFFRSHSMTQAAQLLSSIGTNFSPSNAGLLNLKKVILFTWLLCIVDYVKHQYNIEEFEFFRRVPFFLRLNIILYIIYSIMILGIFSGKEFIYFQF